MFVQRVDDQTPFHPMLTKVEVLPGKHTIVIAYVSSDPLPPNLIRLLPVIAIVETEPGHKYQIDGEGDLFETSKPRVWIVDTTAGKKVWEQSWE